MGMEKYICKKYIIIIANKGKKSDSLRNSAIIMSDNEGDEITAPAPAVPEVAGPMDINTALQEILKAAQIHDGLARGLRESVKALDKRQALLCVLANNCDEQMYVKLIEALCAEHGINLIKVDDNKQLGEWAGLCKIDNEGKARKVVGSSCCVIRDWGKQGQAHEILNEYLAKK